MTTETFYQVATTQFMNVMGEIIQGDLSPIGIKNIVPDEFATVDEARYNAATFKSSPFSYKPYLSPKQVLYYQSLEYTIIKKVVTVEVIETI